MGSLDERMLDDSQPLHLSANCAACFSVTCSESYNAHCRQVAQKENSLSCVVARRMTISLEGTIILVAQQV